MSPAGARRLVYAITLSRLGLAGLFAAGVWWFRTGPEESLAMAGMAMLMVLALLEEATDVLDGKLARRTNTASRLGGIVDPLCDSLSRLTLYFALALGGWIHLAVPLVMAGRDIVVSYTRIVNALTGRQTSARISGKAKAVIQGGGVFAILALAGLGDRFVPHARDLLQTIVAGGIILATLWSLVDYLRGTWPGVVELYRRAD